MLANQFVARYTNWQGKIIVKRFDIKNPETIYNITEFWRTVEKEDKAEQLNNSNLKETKYYFNKYGPSQEMHDMQTDSERYRVL